VLTKKGMYLYRPDAVQAEDFKSCKTLKQENTPQETTKVILTKHGGKSVDNSLGYAIKKLGQKMKDGEIKK
jgi:hypothetical protein